jgi:hypothetical protein
MIKKTVPPPPPKPNSLSSNILTPRKVNDSDSKNNINKDTKGINSNKKPDKSIPFSENDESFLSSVPNFEDKSSKSNSGD